MSPRLFTAICLALVLAACFTGLGVHPLHEPDEARYGEIAREMVATGDWITPRLDGIRYFEKPPLFFHLAALCMKWLGPTETAARLPSAVAAVLAAGTVLALGRRAFGPRTGALAALMCITAPAAGVFARVAIVDVVLTACTTAALAGAYLAGPGARDVEGTPRRGRAGALLFWGAAGFALLTKGPVGVAIPGAGVAVYALLMRDWALVRALAWPGGPALALVIAAPWTIAMEHANPGWIKAFILEQNVDRFVSGARFGRNVAWWFYLAILPAVFLPWTLLWPRMAMRLAESVRRLRAAPVEEAPPAPGVALERGRGGPKKPPAPPTEADRARVFFAAAAIAPLALLSAAHSQLVYYLLPLIPPLALLAADAFARETERAERKLLPAEGGDSSRAPLPDGRAPEPGPRTPGPGAVDPLTLGDAGSVMSVPLTSRSMRVGPIDPPRPLATAFLVLAVVFAVLAAVTALGHLAPDMVRDVVGSFLGKDPDVTARMEMRLDAVAPLFGFCAAVLAMIAVGSSLTGICEARGLRERAPLPLATAFALALVVAPWVLERAAPVYSAKNVADAVGLAVGPDDEILEFGHFFRSVLFYLHRPAWLWAASYTEFGRSTTQDEIEVRDFDGKADRLEVAWRGEKRWVAICGDDGDLAELTKIVGERRVKVLAKVGGRYVVESRPRAAPAPPPAPPATPKEGK